MEQLKLITADSLIPTELINAKGVKPPIITHSYAVPNEVMRMVFTDQERWSSVQVEAYFDFFDRDDIARFPTLDQVNHKYSRPLLYSSLRELSPEILFEGIIEVNELLRRQGISSGFQRNLEAEAKRVGFRFLTGYQSEDDVAAHFLKRGRYLIDEIKPEHQTQFERVRKIERDRDTAVFYTVKFLNPDDINKYVLPERIGTSVEDKIAYQKALLGIQE